MFLDLLTLLFGIYLNVLSSIYVRKQALKLLPSPYLSLPDLLHNTFPSPPTLVPDYFLMFCTLLTISYYESLLHFDHNFRCLALCILLRSFSVCLTIMPTCMPKPTINNSIYHQLFLSTHDLMFSGHSIFFIFYGNILNNPLITFLGPFLLVISKQHYTIDVCVSGLVYSYVSSII